MNQQRYERPRQDKNKKIAEKPQANTQEAVHAIAKVGQLVDIGAVRMPKKQPRRYFDPHKLDQLATSIQEHGILEPLIVRSLAENQYELVAGERRYRAAKQVGLTHIPVIIKELDENQAFELALLENLQRDDLNPIDETEGILEILSKSLQLPPQEIISLLNRAANAQRRNQPLTDNDTRQVKAIDSLFTTLGRLNRESFRTNRLPLLNLPEDVLEVLRQGKLEYTKAKAIARITDKPQRQQLMAWVIDRQIPLSELKQHITTQKTPEIKNKKTLSDTAKRTTNLRNEFKIMVTTAKSTAWDDENKRQRLEALLTELRKVLED